MTDLRYRPVHLSALAEAMTDDFWAEILRSEPNQPKEWRVTSGSLVDPWRCSRCNRTSSYEYPVCQTRGTDTMERIR